MSNLYGDRLYHHGILGQKWGKQNGPPYPLDANDHSASEKKIGWRKSLNGKKNPEMYDRKDTKEDDKKFKLTDKQKKAIKIGAALVGTALVAYGGYKIYENRGMIKNYMNLGKKNVDFIRKSGKFEHLNTSNFSGGLKLGKRIENINTNMVQSINAKNIGNDSGKINCTHCTTSYLLNSLFGKNTTAKGFDGIDELSGMVTSFRTGNIFHEMFNNVKENDISGNNFKDLISKIPNGSSGGLGMYLTNGNGHMVAYEKSIDGICTLIDGQTGKIYDMSNEKIIYGLSKMCFSKAKLYDFSNATINENSKLINKVVENFVR